MKVVDKEQERIDYENSPAGKRKKWLGLLPPLIFVIVCFALSKILPDIEIGGGKPYVIVMDGLEITPGKTTVQDLADAGYELSDPGLKTVMTERDENGNFVSHYIQYYDLTAEAESRTLYDSLVLVKGEDQAASISILNNGTSAIPLTQCIVTEVTIYDYCVDADKVTVNGTPFPQLTEEMLTELYGKQDRHYDNTRGWNKGNYYFTFITSEDGTVKSISTDKYYRTETAE